MMEVVLEEFPSFSAVFKKKNSFSRSINIGLLCRGLTLCNPTTKFLTVQIESIHRQRHKSDRLKYVLGSVENIMGKANKRAKMALDRSPDFLRLLQPIFFLWLSEKNLQEFLYVCIVQEASIH